MTDMRKKADFATHQRIREMAASGITDLWVECERVYDPQPPLPAAIFGRILDKLIATATSRGIDITDVVAELDLAASGLVNRPG